jgi:hypothetical protein
MQRADQWMLAHPWWYGAVMGMVFFGLMMIGGSLLTSVLVGVGTGVLIGWSASRGPVRRSAEKRIARRVARGG